MSETACELYLIEALKDALDGMEDMVEYVPAYFRLDISPDWPQITPWLSRNSVCPPQSSKV